jgi:hypothetical protein
MVRTRAGAPVYVVTALAALLTIPAVYAVLRGYDVLFRMFWRLGIGTYAAGMVAPLAFLGARANLQRAVQVVTTGAVVVAAMIAVQGIFLP